MRKWLRPLKNFAHKPFSMSTIVRSGHCLPASYGRRGKFYSGVDIFVQSGRLYVRKRYNGTTYNAGLGLVDSNANGAPIVAAIPKLPRRLEKLIKSWLHDKDGRWSCGSGLSVGALSFFLY